MRLQTLFLAATLVASSTSAFAAPFSKLFVFGDSVSDNGNLSVIVDASSGPGPMFRRRLTRPGAPAMDRLRRNTCSLALGLGPLLPAGRSAAPTSP